MAPSLGAAGTALLSPRASHGADTGLWIAGKDVKIQLTSVSHHTCSKMGGATKSAVFEGRNPEAQILK
jgi:hypothetical protein